MASAVVESMAESPTAQSRHVMPGTFNPDQSIDIHDIHDTHFQPVAAVQESSGQRDDSSPSSAHKPPVLDIEGVDWQSYAPPEILRKVPNITSQILLDLVTSSIENIKVQASDEVRRKQEEEEGAGQGSKLRLGGDEPYLPIIIQEERPPTPPPKPEIQTSSEAKSSDSFSSRRTEAIQAMSKSQTPGTISLASRSDKGRKLNFRRFFGRTTEKDDEASDSAMFEAPRRTFSAFSKLEQSASTIVWDPATNQYKRVQRKPQVAKASEPPVELVECVSCLDDFRACDVVKVPCHSYCTQCFAGLISTSVQNEQQWPPKCCLNEIPFRTVLRHVPEDLKVRFRERSLEWNIPAGERVYCNRPECGVWIKPDHINTKEREGRCHGGHWTCTICRGARHPNQACTQDPELLLTNRLAEEQGWKRCGKCNILVEHKDACRHMTCRCGYQFCYVCGSKWCTCSCTGDMLSQIKNEASNRLRERQEREAREAAEAEELRQILAQIEEFEREQALKAEMLRQEQERLEEERRQRELEERAQQERIRLRELELKFAELRKELNILHELQQVMLDEQNEKDATALAEEIQEAKGELREKQSQERADLEADIQNLLSKKELVFEEDFAVRSAAEKKMMAEYQSQLEAFWRSQTDGAQEIEKAMAHLRESMERNCQAWKEWKDGELKAYRERLGNRGVTKEEFLYSAKARLEDKCVEWEADLVKRWLAAQKWMQMVMLERERLLTEMEVDEMKGNADTYEEEEDFTSVLSNPWVDV